MARLAGYFLVRTPSVPLGSLALLVVAAGLTLVTSEAVLALVAVAFLVALLRTARPMITEIRDSYTA